MQVKQDFQEISGPYDVAVLGAGPAGLAAALNAAVRNQRVLVMGPAPSGHLLKAEKISNYLGLEPLSGEVLLRRMRDQLEGYDQVDFLAEQAQVVYKMGESLGILRENQEIIESRAVVLATGVNFGRPLPGEEEFMGKGVGTCATCDAALYKGEAVIVIGYNAHAVEEANFIGEMASSTVFVNQTGGPVDLSDRLVEVDQRPKAIVGSDKAEALLLEDGSRLEAKGIFVIRDAVKLDQLVPGLETEGAHVLVDGLMHTSMAGVFACGDLVGPPYQVQAACGRGQIAGLEAAHYADQQKN